MQRLKLLGLALIAVFAFSATATAVALAETEEKPNALPTGVKFKVVNADEPELLNKTGTVAVKCEQLSGAGAMNKNLGMDGEVSLLFEKCKGTVGGVTANCTSLTPGVPAGDIHVLGAAVNLRYLSPSSDKKVNLAILLNESSEDHVHYMCGIVLVLLSGCVASDDIEVNTLVTTLALNFLQQNDTQTLTSITNLPATSTETCEVVIMKGSESNEKVAWLGELIFTVTGGGTILIMA